MVQPLLSLMNRLTLSASVDGCYALISFLSGEWWDTSSGVRLSVVCPGGYVAAPWAQPGSVALQLAQADAPPASRRRCEKKERKPSRLLVGIWFLPGIEASRPTLCFPAKGRIPQCQPA